MCLKMQQEMQQARFQKLVQTLNIELPKNWYHDMIVVANAYDDVRLIFGSRSCCAAVLLLAHTWGRAAQRAFILIVIYELCGLCGHFLLVGA